METEKLNLIPNGFKQTCYCSQGDDGRVIRFELLEGISPYILDGSEVITNSVKKPNGDTIINSVPNTEQAYIDVTISADITELAGVAEGEVTITKAGAVIGTQNYILEIEADAYGADVEQRTATGIIATFTTNIIDTLEIEADIEPKQDLNGYSSPFIDSDEVNRVPYLKRAVNGTASRIGNKLYDKLVGGTVAFNQYANKFYATTTQNGITITNNTDGSYTLNGTASDNVSFNINTLPLYLNHIYLALGNKGGSYSTYYLGVAGVAMDFGAGGFWKSTLTALSSVRLDIRANAVIDNVTIIPQIFDLTQMLGATVADYIYGLEQATAGAGVAFFKALGFDKDYYPYNAGELMSVKATAHILRDASDNIIGNYALDSNLELRGLLKLDENNSPYYEGDTYEASGAVTRKYGLVDLGSLSWTYNSEYSRFDASNDIGAKPALNNHVKANALCGKIYTIGTIDDLGSKDKFIYIATAVGSGKVRVIDRTYNDATAFKASLSGVYLLYELATPTTEQATAFTNPQNVIEGGTEEYTDNRAVPIPVGHETYHANICEISGATECSIIRTGKNLFNGSNLVIASYPYPAMTFDKAILLKAGSYTASISDIKNATSWRFGFGFFDKAGNAITKAITSGLVTFTGAIFYDTYNDGKTCLQGSDVNDTVIKFTLTQDVYIVCCVSYGNVGITTSLNYQIELGSEASAFEAYTGAEIVIDLNGTVYGGKYNTKTRRLELTHAKDSFSNKSFTQYSTGFFAITPFTTKINGTGLCEVYSVVIDKSYANAPDKSMQFRGNQILIKDTSCADVTALIEKLGSYEFTYELADPIEVQLTGAELESLLGVNNVWASTGAVKVNYLYRATDEA